MAIQFPPVLPGDPEPQDGDTYLYLITKSLSAAVVQSLRLLNGLKV